PPRTIVVPSSLVWERVLRESHPQPDRLRWWISLFLAALIVTALVSALVPPRGASTDRTQSKLIVIVDDSATLATQTTDGATRWDHALTKARSVIGARSAGTQVWLADTMRRIATPGFLYRDDALAQLAKLRVTHGFAPVVPLPEQSADIETVFITDGVSIGPGSAQARLEFVFESVENAGITAFELRRLPADPRRYLAYVEVVNGSGIEKSIELAVVGIGGKRVGRTVAIEAGGQRQEVFDVSDFDGGPVRASITMPGDGLAVDDVAYASLPGHRVMRLALVSAGNAFLAKSLQSQPRVSLTVMAPREYVDDRAFDAVVFDRYAPKVRPHVPALLFLPSSADWLPPRSKGIANVPVSTWDAAHPLLDNISLLDLSVDRATSVDLKNQREGSTIVLASAPGGTPLIVAHDDGARWISFSFALADSNFPLHAGFPIFLDNALNWMLGEQPVLARGLGLIHVPVPGARVVAADGMELPTQATAGGSLFEVNAPGLFTIVSAHQRQQVAANLFDRHTTEVNKSTLRQIQPAAEAPSDANRSLPLDPASALLLAAALLLLAEWWSWNRRLTI
ncbi:MAG: hypothetical protein ABI619_11490, partial [Betaproteobacteria bacterium]